MVNDSLAIHGLESGLESQWDSEETRDQIFQPDENGMIEDSTRTTLQWKYNEPSLLKARSWMIDGSLTRW